ncbi:MAG TPA: DUF4433 domain-containing protein [Dokdonella sp.]
MRERGLGGLVPGNVPIPTRIFHITSIQNLPAIFGSGVLLSKNALGAANTLYANIAYATIQARRANQQVECGPGGVIHDYVPFYFAPQSPMLYAVHTGTVPGCVGGQAEIVHFESSAQNIRAAGLGFAFFDMHSSVALSQAYDDLGQLGAVAWDVITEAPSNDGYCRYWQSDINKPKYARRKELRQAEFLVHRAVPLHLVTRVGVLNEQARERVDEIARSAGRALRVDVCSDWYY